MGRPTRKVRTCASIAAALAFFSAIAGAQGEVQRVSVSSAAAQGNADSGVPALSGDGRYVVFSSRASNLASGTMSSARQIYLRDRASSTTQLITRSPGGVGGNGNSDAPAISADGRYVVFQTDATNLALDTNGSTDVYLHDRVSGTFTLVSSGPGGGATGGSYSPAISADGRWVAFYSLANDVLLSDGNGVPDAFVYDRVTATTQLASLADSNGTQGNASTFPAAGAPYNGQIAVASNATGTGCLVAFHSSATNLVASPPNPNSVNGLYWRDLQAGVTRLLSVDVNGNHASNGAVVGLYAGVSMSSDGRYVAFDTNARLIVPGDTASTHDIFVRDVLSSTTVRASQSSQQLSGIVNLPFGTTFPRPVSISADGAFVAFESAYTNLVPDDANGQSSIFVRDLVQGRTRRIDTGSAGVEGDGASVGASLSADGRYVAFASLSRNLVPSDTNNASDVFVEVNSAASHGICFGDGVDTGTTPCPCATGGFERGCANSVVLAGGLLEMVGTASISGDTAILAGAGMPNSSVLYFQGTANPSTCANPPSCTTFTTGVPFGDGLRCVSGTVLRLGTKTNSAGRSSYPAAGDLTISVKGLIAAPGTRYYQGWYRNAASFCTASTFNLTNGVSVSWAL